MSGWLGGDEERRASIPEDARVYLSNLIWKITDDQAHYYEPEKTTRETMKNMLTRAGLPYNITNNNTIHVDIFWLEKLIPNWRKKTDEHNLTLARTQLQHETQALENRRIYWQEAINHNLAFISCEGLMHQRQMISLLGRAGVKSAKIDNLGNPKRRGLDVELFVTAPIRSLAEAGIFVNNHPIDLDGHNHDLDDGASTKLWLATLDWEAASLGYNFYPKSHEQKELVIHKLLDAGIHSMNVISTAVETPPLIQISAEDHADIMASAEHSKTMFAARETARRADEQTKPREL